MTHPPPHPPALKKRGGSGSDMVVVVKYSSIYSRNIKTVIVVKACVFCFRYGHVHVYNEFVKQGECVYFE